MLDSPAQEQMDKEAGQSPLRPTSPHFNVHIILHFPCFA
jgi:hypothetical protein